MTDFLTHLRAMQTWAPGLLPIDAPPCDATGMAEWDHALAGTFNRACLAETDDERFRILGRAAERFADLAATVSEAGEHTRASELIRCRNVVAGWFTALQTITRTEV